MSTSAPPRTVHVEHCMGTVFSIDIRDPGDWREPLAEVLTWLHHVDEVFSTYRADSIISRLRRGELDPGRLDAETSEVLALCAALNVTTGGYFDAAFDGAPDPTGVVKGWAIEHAAGILSRHGITRHAVNGGGDMQLTGTAGPDLNWRVGISDPFDRTRVHTVLSGLDLAVATSGTAERGAHVRNPLTGRAAESLASVTVTGPSLRYVDAYATAAFAMGPLAFAWLQELPDHEGMVIDTLGQVRQTAGFPVAR